MALAPDIASADARVFLTCPRCGRRLRGRTRDVGRMVQCPACGMRAMVPTPPRPRPGPAENLVTIDIPPGRGAPPDAAGPDARPRDLIVLTNADLADVESRTGLGASPTSIAPMTRGQALRDRRKSARPLPRDTRLKSKHLGRTCPYCLSPIKPEGDLIVCPECGIPHHVECWQENSGCTTWGCRAAPRPSIRPVAEPVAAGPNQVFGAFNRRYTAQRDSQTGAEGCATPFLKVVGIIGLAVILIALASSSSFAGRGAIWILVVIAYLLISLIRRGE